MLTYSIDERPAAGSGATVRSRSPLAQAGVAKVPGIELAGGAYHGIGIGDCLREGAAAADRALEHVRGLPEEAVPPQPSDVPAANGITD